MQSNNSSLRSDIEAALEFEPGLDAASIGVTVKDGVATLTGHVDSYAQKAAAEHAAAQVKSVRAVAEEIEVRLPFEAQHDDDEIARRALNVLTWGAYLPDKSVQVKVADGWITLTGMVDWRYQRRSVEEAMEWLGGVKGITNLIAVKPSGISENVRERLVEAYRRNADLESSRIIITVNDGKVTLSGTVKTWGDRLTAADAAWAIPSVTEVNDNLMVA
jgi:osmotically-inducible protein OsmY